MAGFIAASTIGPNATAQSFEQTISQWNQKLAHANAVGDIIGAAQSRIVLASLYTNTPGIGLEAIETAKSLLAKNTTPYLQRLNPQIYAFSALAWAEITLKQPHSVRKKHLDVMQNAARVGLQHVSHFGDVTLQAARVGLASSLLTDDLSTAKHWIEAGFARDKFNHSHNRSAQDADLDRSTLYDFLHLVATYHCRRNDAIGAWRTIEDSRRYAFDAPRQENPWITNPHSQIQTRPLSRLADQFDAVVGITVSVAGSFAVVSKKGDDGKLISSITELKTTQNEPFNSDVLDDLVWGQPLLHAQVHTRWGGWYGIYGSTSSDEGWAPFRRHLASQSENWWDSFYASLHQALTQEQDGNPSTVLLIQPSTLSAFQFGMIQIPGTDKTASDEVHFNYAHSLKQAASCLKNKNITMHKVSGLYNPTKDLKYAEAEASLAEAIVGEKFKRIDSTDDNRLNIQTLKGQDCHALVLGTHASIVNGIALGLGEWTSNKKIFDSRGSFEADYVILSACESGVNGPFHDSSKLHLAHVLLNEGVTGVVAAKWEVDDAATSLLVSKLIENLIIHKKTPAHALATAQRWLRNATTIELEDFVVNLVDRLPETSSEASQPLQSFLQDLRIFDGESARPFENPFFWGGFVYFGV